MTATPKQGTDLMNFFATNAKVKFNRATAKWAARELVDSYGMDKCKEAILWYTRTVKQSGRHPDWNHFVRVAGDCINQSEAHAADIARRKKFRAQAQEWRKL